MIKWGYETPAKHTHRTSGWTFVDTEVNGEIVLQCPRCETCWHTGIPDSDDYVDVGDLQAAAAAWLRAELLGKVTRRQLPLPLPESAAIVRVVLVKRTYYRAPVADLSAQLALPLMVAA